VFAAKAFNPAGADGLLRGGGGVMVTQLIGVAAAAAYSAVMSLAILKLLDVTIGLRVTRDEESEGLDVTLHGESGYELDITSASAEATAAPAEAPEARGRHALSANPANHTS